CSSRIARALVRYERTRKGLAPWNSSRSANSSSVSAISTFVMGIFRETLREANDSKGRVAGTGGLSVQFDDVFVLDDVVALDGGAGMNLAAPHTSKLQVLGEVFVHKLGNVEQCAAAADRERAIVVGLFLRWQFC